MIEPRGFLRQAREAGFDFATGVPCSILTGLINAALGEASFRYVGAANEGDAVAIAAGAELGGRRAIVLSQNSGFGNAVNPLTSLSIPFAIPCLFVTTWRGEPDGAPDEPQHEVMGRMTPALFTQMGLPFEICSGDASELSAMFARALAHMQQHGTPYGLIVRRGSFAKEALDETAPMRPPTLRPEPMPATWRPQSVDDVLARVRAAAGSGDVLLATTGFTGRALYALGDRASQLYMVGSMGCVSSLGLGLAVACPERRVVVLDGDGAALLRLGALATIGYERPPNLTHVLLDNGVHDSTGGQQTVMRSVDIGAVAAACGYPEVHRAVELDAVGDAVAGARQLTFVHVRTAPRGGRGLPRPEIAPREVARRLRGWLAG